MSARIEHATMLHRQGRHREAGAEAHAILSEDPGRLDALTLFALCAEAIGRRQDADAAMARALAVAPGSAEVRRVGAAILRQRGRYKEAAAQAGEALRLDPHDADAHLEVAAIALARENWADAQAAAERGLAIDAEHQGLVQARAAALLHRGEKAAAENAVRQSLAFDPEDPDAHRLMGITSLADGRARTAEASFREALRLDPTDEAARLGLIEAIKGRHLFYGLMLRGAFWASRFSPRTRVILLVAAFVLFRALATTAERNPQLGPVLYAVLGVYAVACLLTWIAAPLLGLLLRLRPGTRSLFPQAELRAAIVVAACLAAAGALLGIGILTGHSELTIGSLGVALLAWPAWRLATMASGSTRIGLAVYVTAIGCVLLWAIGQGTTPEGAASIALPLALVGLLFGGLLAESLSRRVPLR